MAMVVSGGSPEEAVQTSCAFFDSILSSSGSLEAQLSPFLESILIDSVSVGISRKVLSYVILKIKSMSKIQSLKYCSTLTEALKLRLMSFEDQITDINQHMADLYESQQDYNKAAFHLSAIPLENSQKNYTKIFTTQMYLKIAQLYIEGHDANQAEIFINRASLLITSNTDPDLQVSYFKAVQGRSKIVLRYSVRSYWDAKNAKNSCIPMTYFRITHPDFGPSNPLCDLHFNSNGIL